MTVRSEWEVRVDQTIGELAASTTTVGLYGSSHPRAVQAVQRLASQLDSLLGTESELAFVLLGEELFIQGRPFTRVSRHAASLIRRFRRRDIEHATFQLGLTLEEVGGFIGDLARTDDYPVKSRPHVQVGQVEISSRHCMLEVRRFQNIGRTKRFKSLFGEPAIEHKSIKHFSTFNCSECKFKFNSGWFNGRK